MGATRLPGKILKKIDGVTLLQHEIKRVRRAGKINKIVVATTVNKIDDKTEKLCQQIKVDCFRGSEDDVLDRYYQCSLLYPQYKNIIRISGDCPLIDPAVIDRVVALFESKNYDYASNILKETFPDGMDIEIFKRGILGLAAKKAKLRSEREHVTLYIRNNKRFRMGNLSAEYDWSHFRLTVDEKEDLEVIKFLIRNSKLTDGYLHYISLLTKNPQIMFKNMHVIRNEGLLKSLRNDFKVK